MPPFPLPVFCNGQLNYLSPRIKAASGPLHRWALTADGRGKPELTLFSFLLPPQISKQEREDKTYLNLPTHDWIYYPPFHSMPLCILSRTGSVQVWVSLRNSWQSQVRYEEDRIHLYLGFGILFLFANSWSSIQLYLGMKTIWYKSKRNK